MAVIPLFDGADHPSVPTLRPERRGGGRRSRMAGGHRAAARTVLEGRTLPCHAGLQTEAARRYHERS
jgi:hypothetical protein